MGKSIRCCACMGLTCLTLQVCVCVCVCVGGCVCVPLYSLSTVAAQRLCFPRGTGILVLFARWLSPLTALTCFPAAKRVCSSSGKQKLATQRFCRV